MIHLCDFDDFILIVQPLHGIEAVKLLNTYQFPSVNSDGEIEFPFNINKSNLTEQENVRIRKWFFDLDSAMYALQKDMGNITLVSISDDIPLPGNRIGRKYTNHLSTKWMKKMVVGRKSIEPLEALEVIS